MTQHADPTELEIRREHNTRCPRCWYNDTGPLSSDYEWLCRGCLTIFDADSDLELRA